MSDIRDNPPEALREFLDSERNRPDPSPEVEQRVFSRLATTLALSPPPSAPASPAAPAAQALGVGGVRRVLGIFLVGAAVGAGGYGVLQAVRQPAPAQPAALPIARETVPPPTPEPSALQVEPPPTPAPRVSVREPGESRDQRLAAERRLLEQARTALVNGNADAAIVSLRRHARVFADGQLAEERDALLIRALVSTGDYAQARARTSRFHRQHPRSLFFETVEQAIRSIP